MANDIDIIEDTETAVSARPVYTAVRMDPPAPKRRGRQNGLHDTLVEIRTTPNEWFAVGTFKGKTGASSVKSAIEAVPSKRVVPAGSYEYTARADETNGGSVLFARFLGE